MSVFSKPPNDGRSADGSGKLESQGKPAAAAPHKPAPRIPPIPARSPAASVPGAPPSASPSFTGRAADAPGHSRSHARPAAPSLQLAPSPPSSAVGLPAVPSSAASPFPAGALPASLDHPLSLDDLDDRFAHMVRAPEVPSRADALPTDLADVRELFAQLAATHLRQVRDFLIDLRWSEANVDWIAICQPALRSLRRAAEKLELVELCGALDAFAEALVTALAAGSRVIEGDVRTTILARSDVLVRLMPQAFALDLDRTQRETVILQSLLLQVPEVKKVTVDKLYSAGLTTLEALLLANPGDIVATTGLSESVASRIVDRFRAYHQHAKDSVPDATRSRERDAIADLTARLRREHYEHELAAQGWTREAMEKRKALRLARTKTMLDIQVMLARLGEVARLAEIERLPFERKVSYLESFLEEARNKYTEQP